MRLLFGSFLNYNEIGYIVGRKWTMTILKNVEPDVDIVVTWVDDNDIEWRETRDRFKNSENDSEAQSDLRFRDWDLLRYWFRGIANYAPWVRRVYLVTVNPVPKWLNLDNGKVVVVHHEDFIPREYLPTYNSRVIELNLHRIEGLSENFVYFNDDYFLCKPTKKSHFFKGDLPRAMAVLNSLSVGDNISHAMLNNIQLLNENFSKHHVLRESPLKWFNLKYGISMLQNLALLPWPRFTGFHNHHLPLALKRSVAEEIWNREFDALDRTSRSRFRQFTDVNPFLISWWSICSGKFAPAHLKKYGRYFQLDQVGVAPVVESIRKQKYSTICINDGSVPDLDAAKHEIQSAFESILSEPCRFER